MQRQTHTHTDTHRHTQKATEISIVSLSAVILVSTFCLTMYNQWQSMYQSAIRMQLAGGHILPWSASLSCWSCLPDRPPACTIPCQSNFAGNLEGRHHEPLGGSESRCSMSSLRLAFPVLGMGATFAFSSCFTEHVQMHELHTRSCAVAFLLQYFKIILSLF